MVTTLLPANATPVERALEDVLTAAPTMRQRAGEIPGIKFNAPDVLLPWLVHEYGLAEVAPYIGDLRRVIADGLIWQRRRGTGDALLRALAWIQVSAPTVEEEEPGEHWSEIQIDPGRIPSEAERRSIQALTNLSLPARSRLARIHHGYDVRRFILDRSRFGDLLSDYSGVMVDGTVLSFGRFWSGEAYGTAAIPTLFRQSNRSIQTVYEDRFILDHSRFGEKPVANLPMTHAVLRGFETGSLATPPPLSHRTLSRAQVVLSGGDPLGSLNERFSPRIQVEVGGPMILSGGSRLDDETHRFEWQPVDIYPERTHGMANVPDTTLVVDATRTNRHGHGWRRPRWPILSGSPPERSAPRNRQVNRGLSAVYAKQPWLGATWPSGITWNNLNTLIGMNHQRST